MVKIAKPFVTHADESPAYWQIGNLWQIMATGVQTDNNFTLLDQWIHAGTGGGPITHAHAQDEGMYVVSGKCTFNAGGNQGLPGTPGGFVHIPKNTEHSFTVDEPNTHILNFYLPAGFEQILIGVSHPANDHKYPPTEEIEAMLPPRWLAEKLSEDYGQASIAGNPFVDMPEPSKMLTKPLPGATVFPYITNISSLAPLNARGGQWKVLADTQQTGGSYCLFEVAYSSPGPLMPKLQVYENKDLMFYILDGNMTFLLGDQEVKVKKESFIYIPAGNLHCARIDSAEANFIHLQTTSGYEELIRYESQFMGAKSQPDVRVTQRLHEKLGLKVLDVPNPLA